MRRMPLGCKVAVAFAAATFCTACTCQNWPLDSGVDGGVDAGPADLIDAGPEYRDGGEIEATGGCYDRQGGRKFILYFETAGLCSGVSFRRFDGGFEPLFAQSTTGPENYLIDDARVGLCSMPFEQADGQLNQNAARIDSFRGAVGWAGFQVGRPWTYSARGTIALFGSEFRFSTPVEGAGLSDPCREP